MSQDLESLKDWIDKSETVQDRATVLPVHGYAALRDRDDVPKEGDPIGPMGHWFFFKPVAPASQIGPDGHPKRGGFMPPVPLPRRMFGGARTTYHKDLLIGEMMRKVSTITDVQIKDGRTGTLVICIVYRGNPPANANGGSGNSGRTGGAPEDHQWIKEITPDPVMLFRYSAITFNGHRIHYDRPYAMEEEGYPGLVVHGPLTAVLLIDLVRRHADRPVKGYSFRGKAPIFDLAPFRVVGIAGEDGKVELEAQGPDGVVAMSATAELG